MEKDMENELIDDLQKDTRRGKSNLQPRNFCGVIDCT